MRREVRGGETGKLNSFELDPAVRTNVVVKSDFQTLPNISAELFPKN